MAALRAGKHVICEKPLAMTVAQADEMIAEAQAADRLLVANLMQRYNPLSDAVGRLVESKVLGEPLHGSFENYASDENLGPDHWFWDRSKSGGIFIEHGVHFFDLFAGWLGPGTGRGGPAAGCGPARRPPIEEHVQLHGPVRTRRPRQLLPRLPPDRPDGPPGAAAGLRARRRDALRLGADPATHPRDRRRGPDPRPLRALPRRPARRHGDLRRARTGPAPGGTRRSTSTRCWNCTWGDGTVKSHRYGELLRALMTDQVAWIRDRSHPRRITEANGRDSLAVACEADRLRREAAE